MPIRSHLRLLDNAASCRAALLACVNPAMRGEWRANYRSQLVLARMTRALA